VVAPEANLRASERKKCLVPGSRNLKQLGLLAGVVILATGMLWGCSASEDTGRKTSSSVTSPSASEQEDGGRTGSRHPITAEEKSATQSTASDAKSPGERLPASGPASEKITGYKTSAEYFSIPSRNYSQGIVAVSLPLDYDKNPSKKYPLLIVFGGAGECARSPRQSALAWMHYYKADEAVLALQGNRLVSDNFRGLVKPHELNDFNRRLKRSPYEGIILACPSTPLVSAQAGPELPEMEEYIMDELLPALKKRYRVMENRIGVDGVSMGGSRSMFYGLKYPEVFSSIGSVQGAFGPYLDIYRYLVKTNRQLLRKRSLQLITSDRDVMLQSVETMHKLLLEHHIPHSYLVLTGPHDYIFNQGPGAISLLVFHNQALRRSN